MAVPDQVLWPMAEAPRGLVLLAREALGVSLPSARALPAPPDPRSLAGVDRWVGELAGDLGVDALLVQSSLRDLGKLFAGAAPALLVMPGDNPCALFLCAVGRGRRVCLLGRDGERHWLHADELVELRARNTAARFASSVDEIVKEAGTRMRRPARMRRALLEAHFGDRQMGWTWLLSSTSPQSFRAELREAGLLGRLLASLGMHALAYALFTASWWVLGESVLGGKFSRDRLLLWTMLVGSSVVVRLIQGSYRVELATRFGLCLRRRLLRGTLLRDEGRVRAEGVGINLGRAVEGEALETLSVSSALSSLNCLVELPVAAWLFAQATGTLASALLFGGAFALWLVLGLRCHRDYGAWVGARIALTQAVVENLVGHQTRLVQGQRERVSHDEDALLESYYESSRKLDGTVALFGPVLFRSFLGVGLAIAFAQALGTELDVLGGAAAVGALLLGQRALATLCAGTSSLVGMSVAFGAVRELLRVQGADVVRSPSSDHGPVDSALVLRARGLTYRHPGTQETILEAVNLDIREGERILLEGPSGSGKSTLASTLAGLRSGTRGFLLLQGRDASSLPRSEWRRKVVLVSQIHENHILCGTLAFNLLMGRAWPAAPEDLAEAEDVCRELGLGELIDRMPGGLSQAVGDGGWQLSHGERSRVFIARAILQNAALTVFDESFGALDPSTLRIALRCALARCRALMVIAHP